jgi:NodT family efflux transporter outer membrane factor (OMF) lipoprotein
MRNTTKIMAAFTAALLLTACVDTPPTEPQVKEIDATALGLSQTPAPALSDQWWKGFNDPQIDRLAEAMLRGNPTLTAAMARIRAAQSQLSVDEAKDLPQVTLDGSEQRTLFSKDYIIPPPYGGSWRWYGQLTTNLTWDLDLWGKQKALIEKARDTAQATAYDAAAARLALSGALAQSYLSLMLAYENGDIADATVAEREAILKLTEGRYQSGLENASAVEQAKNLLAQAKIDQRRFAAQRDLDVHAIVALLGEGANAYGTIERPRPALDAALPLPATLPADLLARRPDILAARARVAAAAKGREAAHAEFYPDISINALVGFQAIGLSNLISGGAFTTGVGPAIHLPIFDAGKIRADYAGATAGLDEAVADYNGSVVNAIRQSADAMTQVASLTARRADVQDALDSATRAFTIAQDRYRMGLANQLPMLNAEASVLQARQQMAALLAETTVQRVTLLLSVGGAFHDTPINIARQD